MKNLEGLRLAETKEVCIDESQGPLVGTGSAGPYMD